MLAPALVLGLWPLSAAAQPSDSPSSTGGDYDVANTDWNGLSELAATQRQLGRQVVVDSVVDLAHHPPEEPIVLVYPTGALPAAEIQALIADGGRVLVADDFGSAAGLLEAFGVELDRGPVDHTRYLNDNDALPVLTARGEHPVLLGVHQVVANHPASLLAEGAPLLAFDGGRGLLYDWVDPRSGGHLIVLSDPSMLVNFMLHVGDNRALAMNLVRFVCAGHEPCRVHLLTGDRGGIVGRYPAPEEPPEPVAQRLGAFFRDSFRTVNQALDRVESFQPDLRGVFFASIFLGLGICVFLLSALPMGRPRWLSFSLRLPPGVRSRSEFEWNLERLLKGGRNDDFGLPLAILKDEFEEVFLGELAQHPAELAPGRRYEGEQLELFARRFAERAVPEDDGPARNAAAARALATLRSLARLPSRNSLVPEVDGRYSERLLRRIYRETRGLLDDLGIWERYERRSGRP